MSQQLSDILNAVLDHRWPLQTQAPTINPHVRRETHGLQHLRSEHATVAYFHPLVQPIVETEDLQAGFCVGVVGRLETQAVDAHFGEEDFHEAYKSSQGQTIVCYDTFDLVEFSEMCGVDAFVAEDPIDREIARGTWVRSKFMKHVGGNGGGVRSEDEFERFVVIERVAVAYGAVLARLMDLFHVLEIFVIVLLGFFW